jgi:hypothetical protein
VVCVTDPYGRNLGLFLSNSSSIVLTRLSGPIQSLCKEISFSGVTSASSDSHNKFIIKLTVLVIALLACLLHSVVPSIADRYLR